MCEKKLHNWMIFTVGMLIGALCFLIVYGTSTLNVSNYEYVKWGYDEWDIQQREAGWLNYRNSSWQFPLASADTMAYPAEKGANIAFTDSLPVISVFFKLISGILPEKFSYQGIVQLLFFMLQGGTAALLLMLFFKSPMFIFIGSIFFTMSPIMLERAFRHLGLSAHFLILLAMYFYFKYRRTQKYPWLMCLLPVLAVGITPYWLPIVMIFIFLLCLENVLVKDFPGRIWKAAIFMIVSVALGIATAIIFGTVGGGYASSRDGYGFYSMNLNALINPSSCGAYQWSRVLKQRPQLYGQYDGFNYLGLGLLMLGGFDFGIVVFFFIKKKENRLYVRKRIQKNIWLLILMAFTTVFAISNVVCWDNTQIAEIHLPDFLLNLCNIFRASSRMFYPVWYLILLTGLVILWRYFSKKSILLAIVACSIFVGIQLMDLSGVISEKHENMKYYSSKEFPYPDELKDLTEYKEMLLLDNEKWGTRFLLILAGENHLVCNGTDTNTETAAWQVTSEYKEAKIQKLMEGNINKQTVYATYSQEMFQYLKKMYAKDADFCTFVKPEEYKYYWPGDVYFMLPHQEKIENR